MKNVIAQLLQSNRHCWPILKEVLWKKCSRNLCILHFFRQHFFCPRLKTDGFRTFMLGGELLLKNSLKFSGFLMVWFLLLLMVGCATQTPAASEKNVLAGLYDHNPKAAAVNVQLGLAYLKQGDMQRAKRKLLLASKQDGESAIVQDALAYYYEKTGESALAEQHYLAAIQLDPASGDLHNNYGAFLCRQRRFNLAEKEFMQAVADKKYLHTAEAYENAGLCAIDNKQYEDAHYYLEKALQNDPKLIKARMELKRMKSIEKENHG
ncbi:MAG: type IV pilus biogenesis/stability protein PilW [Gammaproteobacteria bacterium]